MAKGRMLNRTVAHDERLAQLSLAAEYVYLKTIPHLDRDGKVLGYASTIRGQCVPRRAELECWTDDHIEQLMLEWTGTVDQDGHPDPLVDWYEVAGVPVCLFRGFRKNQTLKTNEAVSTLPDPPADLLNRVLHPQPPLKGSVSEGNRSKEKIEGTSSLRDDAHPGNGSHPGNDGQRRNGELEADVALAAPRLSEPPRLSAASSADDDAHPGNGQVPPRLSAQDVVAAYVELARGQGVNPPGRVKGQLAREAKQLLDEGQPPEAVMRALEVLVEKALGPSQLASCVQQVLLERARAPRKGVTQHEVDLSAYVQA